MEDFFEVKIPFNNENPLDLKDLSAYFSRLEDFFHANGVELEIYEAKVGSFIPKMRQIKQGVDVLITLSSVLSNMTPIFEKVNNGQTITQQETQMIQPILAINSNVNVTNVIYNGKNYDTSSVSPSDFSLENKTDDNSKKEELIVKKFESQILVFSKIDTDRNNQCSGSIKNLSDDKKKVTFASLDIKKQFNFTDVSEPFKKSYVVDVNVYYNPDDSIAKYEVINLIDCDERSLFNAK